MADLSADDRDPDLTPDEQALVAAFSPAYLATLDAQLLAQTDGRWRKVAFVVGKVVNAARSESRRIPPVFLSQRVTALVMAGRLESQGHLGAMRFGEVRRRVGADGGHELSV